MQLVATLVVTCVAGFVGGVAASWSALLGGVCCFVPNSLFAMRLFISARNGGANPMTFFFGEFIKIATTFALMGAVVGLYHDIHWLAFIVSFIVVLKSYLILLFKH